MVDLGRERVAWLAERVVHPFVVAAVVEWAEQEAANGFSGGALRALGVEPERVGFMGRRVREAVISAALVKGREELHRSRQALEVLSYVVVLPPPVAGLSRKRNTRDRERSNCQAGGSLRVVRPSFPRVPKAGCAKAAGFRYCVPGRPDVSRYTFVKTRSGR